MQGCFIYQHIKYICYQEITIMSMIPILYLENTINPLIGARNIWIPLHRSSDAHRWKNVGTRPSSQPTTPLTMLQWHLWGKSISRGKLHGC